MNTPGHNVAPDGNPWPSQLPPSSSRPANEEGELPRGVSIILLRGERFAVSQRLSKLAQPCLWQFAGGHVEQGESTEAAARRELREETGLHLHPDRFELIGVAGPLVGYKGEKYMGYRYGVIVHADEEPACTEPDKHTDWKWVSAPELLALPMLQATKEYALTFALSKLARFAPQSATNQSTVEALRTSLVECVAYLDRMGQDGVRERAYKALAMPVGSPHPQQPSAGQGEAYELLQAWGALYNTPPLVVGEEWEAMFKSVFAATCKFLARPIPPPPPATGEPPAKEGA